MHDASSLLALAEQSAQTDLAYLLKAKEESKKRMKEKPSQENIAAFNRARDAVDAETNRLATGPSPLRVYKTQADAVTYLQNAGYKISTATFNRAVKAGKVPTNAAGHYEENVLLAYAGAHREPTAKVENKALSSATTERISADAELKQYQAARQKLRLEKEQGLLMPRQEHERDLAARALFFKREVENFIHLHGAAMLHLVGGDESRLPDLREYWERATADWMHGWAAEREFLAADTDDEEAAAALLSETEEENNG
jgi:hypothetical protein